MRGNRVAVDVSLFSYLAEATGGQRRLCVEGRTVRQALSDLARRYPALAARLWDADGSLSPALAVHLTGRALARPDPLETPLAEGDEIVLLPVVTGG